MTFYNNQLQRLLYLNSFIFGFLLWRRWFLCLAIKDSRIQTLSSCR